MNPTLVVIQILLLHLSNVFLFTFQYMRDKEEMVDLINTQLTVAASEDYGKDLHDVERLIHNFDIFMDNLVQHEEKLAKFNALSNELVNPFFYWPLTKNKKKATHLLYLRKAVALTSEPLHLGGFRLLH